MSSSDSTLDIGAAMGIGGAAPVAVPPAAGMTRKAPAKSPPPQPAPPKAAPQAAAEAAEEAADQQLPDGRPWHRRWLAATPSWLVSLVIHLALIVLLALLVVPAPKQALGTLLEAVTSELEEVELLEPMKMEMVELQTPEMATTSVTAVEVTSTSLADAADLSSVAANLSPGDVEVPASSEIGDLFVGGGGKAMGNVLPSGADKSAQFFGVKASGRRFVFIVDSSNSMRGGKFDAAKEELMYAIRRLSKEQAFYIIFFDQNAERMRLPPSTEPELLPVPAVNENINRAEKWVGTVANELRTDPYDAVKFAIDMVPDAIYLLTDGKFTDRGLTERYLKNNNIIDDPLEGRRPKVVIHTICFWQKDGELALQAIAKDYGGTYRFVPPARGMMKKK